MKVSEMLRVLKKDGWYLYREGRNHSMYRHNTKGRNGYSAQASVSGTKERDRTINLKAGRVKITLLRLRFLN